MGSIYKKTTFAIRKNQTNYCSLMDSMKKRATVRAYSQQDISQELLDELLEIACRSSNTGNMQAYSIVVSRDPARKKALAAYHFNQPQVINAPVVLTFCADFNRFGKWCDQRNARAGFNNIQALAYASIDAVIAAQTLCVAAEEKGLGICYLGTTTYLAEEISEFLELPPLVFPVTTVSLGYPLEAPKQCERLPLEAIVHSEIYRDYTPEDIDRLHLDKEQLPENRHFVEINQKENLAQVFAEIRYTKKDNEHFSDTLVKAVKKQGFC